MEVWQRRRLRGIRDDWKRQAHSPHVWKDTFVIQSDDWIPDDIPVNLGVGLEAERVRDVGNVFLRRRRQEVNLREATRRSVQPYLQRPSSAG